MITLRKVIRGGPDQISFSRLLRAVDRQSAVFTADQVRERGRAQGYDEIFIESAAGVFIETWGNGTEFLDPRVARRDLHELFRVAQPVLGWADQVVAHRHPATALTVAPPLFGDIHRTIDLVMELFQRYWLMLTGVWYAFDLMAIDPGWTATFDLPLFVWPDVRPS